MSTPTGVPAGTPEPPSTPGPDQPNRTKAEIEADIEATREQLGDTVEALTRKLDVKTRTKDKVGETTAHVKENPAVPAGVALGLVVLVVLVVWRRRRSGA